MPLEKRPMTPPPPPQPAPSDPVTTAADDMMEIFLDVPCELQAATLDAFINQAADIVSANEADDDGDVVEIGEDDADE